MCCDQKNIHKFKSQIVTFACNGVAHQGYFKFKNKYFKMECKLIWLSRKKSNATSSGFVEGHLTKFKFGLYSEGCCVYSHQFYSLLRRIIIKEYTMQILRGSGPLETLYT